MSKVKMAKDTGISPENNWQSEDDARTLKRAEEIKNDPKRVEAAKKFAEKEICAFKSVSGIKSKTKTVNKRR